MGSVDGDSLIMRGYPEITLVHSHNLVQKITLVHSHNLVQTTLYILKPPAYREAYGVSLFRLDHESFPPLVDRLPPLPPQEI